MEVVASVAVMIGTTLIANEINKQNQEAKTFVMQHPKTKNRVAYWCESRKQFFPYVEECREG